MNPTAFPPSLHPGAQSGPSRRQILRWTPAAGLAVAGTMAGCSQAQSAPAFAYTLLDGVQRNSRDALGGKVTLVNFWATSCTTCVAEMPMLVETWRKFRERGYETLAVAMSYDPPAYVSRFAQTRGLPFGVAIDNTGAIAQAFGGIQLTPTSLLIDRQGLIVKRYVGAPDKGDFHALIDKLLG